MEKIKNKYSFAIKTTCYILMPILLLSIILSIVSIVYFVGENLDSSIEIYFETKQFSNTYKNSVIDNTDISMRFDWQRQYYLYDELEVNSDIEKIYYRRDLNEKNFKYLVIDKDKKIAFTNYELTAKTDTIEKIKNQININEYYWNYKEGNIATNINNISLDDMKYMYEYERIQTEYNCEIYTSIDESLNYIDQYYTESIAYEILREQYSASNVNIPLSIIILIICIITVTVLAGRKRGKDEIYLNAIDKLPLEIMCIVGFIILIIPAFITIEGLYYNENVILGAIFLPVSYIGLIICYETLIKRLKSHTLLKNTLIYRICKWLLNSIKKAKNIFVDINTSVKLAICLATFILLNYVLIELGFVGVMLLLAMWVYTYIWMCKKINSFMEIKKALKQIYEGNTNIKLDESLYVGVLKELCIYINDIAGGFANAVEQGIKSERMKTELITNVSHDIKTPLTSIINYVDLLKKEEMPNDKAKEYLEILDKKSQRLKRLTEDLVEASKASSGNIKLNMEKINVKELINQISGEFEDRLKERDLNLIIDMPEEDVYIKADSRYLYRVIENMYSNVVKYALEASRVYVDVEVENNNVEIKIKNISKEKLNISADELMQRFVRGEAARNTEGSGLGLSIAQSLTELQKGSFEIYLDGDLFKVVIYFERMESFGMRPKIY